MIERTHFGDVTALRATWARSRRTGYGVHIFLVRGVMIDTGFPGIATDVRDIVAELRPRGVMLTHHHEDHAGNVQQLAELGVPISMDAVTEQWVRNPGRIGLYRHFTWKAMRPVTARVTPFISDALSLLPTPGHCSNHHVVWDATTDTCFGGDLFLGVKVRIAHPDESPRAHVQSLRTVIARNPARLFCAHRGYVENGVARLTAKANWLDDLIGCVDRLLDEGRRDNDIRSALLGHLGSTHFISAGDYSPLNLIAAIRKTRPSGSDRNSLLSALPFAPRAHQ